MIDFAVTLTFQMKKYARRENCDHGELQHRHLIVILKLWQLLMTLNGPCWLSTCVNCGSWCHFHHSHFRVAKKFLALFVREWLHIAKGYRETLGIKKGVSILCNRKIDRHSWKLIGRFRYRESYRQNAI